MSARVLEALERMLARDGEPDDVLRRTVATLVEEPGIVWAGIAFLEQDGLVLGPAVGHPDEQRRETFLIAYRGSPVGELWIDGDADREQLEQIAEQLSAHVLIGWDTGGASWQP